MFNFWLLRMQQSDDDLRGKTLKNKSKSGLSWSRHLSNYTHRKLIPYDNISLLFDNFPNCLMYSTHIYHFVDFFLEWPSGSLSFYLVSNGCWNCHNITVNLKYAKVKWRFMLCLMAISASFRIQITMSLTTHVFVWSAVMCF